MDLCSSRVPSREPLFRPRPLWPAHRCAPYRTFSAQHPVPPSLLPQAPGLCSAKRTIFWVNIIKTSICKYLRCLQFYFLL